MKRSSLVFMLAASAAVAQPLHKCRNEDGTYSYQQEPCSDDQTKVATPLIYKPPSLTEAEKLRIFGPPADDEAAMSQDYVDAMGDPNSLPEPPDPGPGPSSNYARGEVTGVRCTRPDGTVYYTRDECGRSRTKVIDQNPTIAYEAIDPTTGEVLETGRRAPDTVVRDGHLLEPNEVEWRARPVRRSRKVSVPDQRETIGADPACRGAREQAERLRAEGAGFEARRRADDQVESLCRQGRSMWEQR